MSKAIRKALALSLISCMFLSNLSFLNANTLCLAEKTTSNSNETMIEESKVRVPEVKTPKVTVSNVLVSKAETAKKVVIPEVKDTEEVVEQDVDGTEEAIIPNVQVEKEIVVSEVKEEVVAPETQVKEPEVAVPDAEETQAENVSKLPLKQEVVNDPEVKNIETLPEDTQTNSDCKIKNHFKYMEEQTEFTKMISKSNSNKITIKYKGCYHIVSFAKFIWR